MDIAAVASSMKATEVAYNASTAVMNKSMDSMEQIATQLVDQLLSLDFGPAMQSKVDISI